MHKITNLFKVGDLDLEFSYSGTFFAARSIPKNAYMGHQGSDWMILGGYRKSACRKITCLPGGTSCDKVPEVDAAITLELQNHPSERHCLFVHENHFAS